MLAFDPGAVRLEGLPEMPKMPKIQKRRGFNGLAGVGRQSREAAARQYNRQSHCAELLGRRAHQSKPTRLTASHAFLLLSLCLWLFIGLPTCLGADGEGN